MTYKLSNRSLGKLEGVHPDMVATVKRAIELTKVDFGITCGLRTVEEQKKLVASGRSQTMNSKHIPQTVSRILKETYAGKSRSMTTSAMPWQRLLRKRARQLSGVLRGLKATFVLIRALPKTR